MPDNEQKQSATIDAPPSYTDMREMLHEAVVADLLGPAGGPVEEILGSSVRDRYLVGKLAPTNAGIEPGEVDDLPGDADTGSDDGKAEKDTLQAESLIPSSFGLTFCVDPEATSLKIEASWGNYQRTKSEVHMTDAGQARTVWKREPAGGTISLALTPGPIKALVPDPDRPDVRIEGIVRATSKDAEKIITLFLVNAQEAQEKNKDETWLFQPKLVVTSPDGTPIFCKKISSAMGSDDEDRAALTMLYRDKIEFASGHGVSVHATTAEGAVGRAVSLETVVIPDYDVPMTEAPSTSEIPGLDALELDMKTLSELETDKLIETLAGLAREYKTWIENQNARVEKGELDEYKAEAEKALQKCRTALARIEAGIGLLKSDEKALDAFRFANRSMWLQRVRGIYALLRRRGKDVKIEDIDEPSNRSWRPFQLAFFLLALPSLAEPLHPDRTETLQAVADLLWFPTGGGKTEAYLGLAAFAMAMRRLGGDLGGLDGAHGLAVIMRYTLRLLTLQQFQRASTLICAMEYLRREAAAKGEKKWGDTPFRLGLWVGQRATPNTCEESRQALENAIGDSWKSTGAGTPAQLTACPWCGEVLVPGSDIIFRPVEDRTLFFCSAKYGRCPFSPTQTGEGIPVVVVDEEIYRLLPSMLVATVDKFAQMPWRGEVQTLFGRVSGICPRHGYLTPESTDTGKHRKSGNYPKTERVPCKTLRPPDLIIQDELHLISGPLGTMVGLYETAVEELCTWEHEGKKVRPKVIASTATIRRAKEQVRGVFLKDVHVFPPHGLEASDNFFSRQRSVSQEKPGRRYLGICAPGQSRPAVLIRVYVAFLTAAQQLREKYGAAADPWMTTVGYFNSLRELGGMRRLAEDDVRTRAFRVAMVDFERPGLVQRDVRIIRELTSRVSSADIPRILDQLEIGFPSKTEKAAGVPIDIMLATNMVSVGVDVQRLGLMIVNGQPKTTAEYIQATSRVGRRYPGLVCTVLNWSRPRDLSHYESFEHYHATFYHHVEALSVTPFAPRAIDRGLTGILASVIRQRDLQFNPNSTAGNLKTPSEGHAVNAKGAIVARALLVTDSKERSELTQQLVDDRVDNWAKEAQVLGRTLGYRGKKDGETVGLLEAPGIGPWTDFTVPTSMREVEPGVFLVLKQGEPRVEPEWKKSKAETEKKAEAAK